jgi:hypothetical protein
MIWRSAPFGGVGADVAATLAVGFILAAGPCAAADMLAAQVAWRHAPTHADVLAANPANVTAVGAVTLRCEIKPDGALSDCVRLGDGGGAFEQRARSLIPSFAAVFPAGVSPGDRVFSDIEFRFDRSSAPLELAEPQFVQRVGASAAADDFPAEAAKAGVRSGLGVVECDGLADGRLGGCVVAQEFPQGTSFGDSALALAATLRLNPWQDGQAIVGARVRLPLYIDAPGAAADPSFTRSAVFHLEFGWKTNPYYPMQAYLQHMAGEVTLQCVLARSGVLSDCVSLEETPTGQHFADAALRMAERRAITAKPAARSGGPSDAEVVRVEVPFKL